MSTQERSSPGGVVAGRDKPDPKSGRSESGKAKGQADSKGKRSGPNGAGPSINPRTIKIAGLSVVIIGALLFTLMNLFGGSSPSPTAGTKGRPIDAAQIALAQAVMTEQNKWKFAGINIRASEDGTKLIVSGKVGTDADLSELQKLIDGSKGSTAVEFSVTVNPATGPKVEIPGLGK